MSRVRIIKRKVPPVAAPLHENPLVHRVLAARGVTVPEELNLALKGLPRPDDLPDIDKAVQRLVAARVHNERVLVIGDYDCDGATSTAVAMLGFSMLGFRQVDYLIPNRFSQGYGLSPLIVDKACDLHQPDLIVTVDNGVASVEGVATARQRGVDVVVTDHHLPPEVLPNAVAIVNPNLSGSTFAGTSLAGVGVMFYTLIALRKALTAIDAKCGNAPLATLLDLVAIGTVADVVPMDAINRILVEQGLRRIRGGRTRPGVRALLKVAGRSAESMTTQDIGFGLGPRLNAAGRLDDMTIGVECLLTESAERAGELATSLNEFNQERRRIERGMRDTAAKQLAEAEAVSRAETSRFTVCLMQEDWHQGVIGILAGRIKESLHRPVVIFAGDGEEHLKGSARSIDGIHIRDVLQTIVTGNPGVIEKFGGHAMAAGLTLARARYDEFKAAFEHEVHRLSHGQLAVREHLTDGALVSADWTLANTQVLASIMPWGQHFEAPVFDGQFRVVSSRPVGKGGAHLKLSLELFNESASTTIDAIAFNCTLQPLPDEPVLAVYSLDINVWRDRRSVQLIVHHIEQAALR